MQLRRVGVLGGGPGGLYAARLLKLARPSCDVIVYEQGEPGTTFGFGVGLAAGTEGRPWFTLLIDDHVARRACELEQARGVQPARAAAEHPDSP